MTAIKNLTEKVQGNLGTQDVFLDPATVIMVAELVITILQAIKKCRENKQQQVMVAQYPTEREKKVLKRTVRKKLGLIKYFKEGDKYYNAVLTTGSQAKAQDLSNAFEEC